MWLGREKMLSMGEYPPYVAVEREPNAD